MRYDTVYIVILLALAVFLGAWLLRVSQEVQDTKVHIAQLEQETQEAKEKTHALEVEWHALSRPDRLEALMRAQEDCEQGHNEEAGNGQGR